jgi:hypothetical protein
MPPARASQSIAKGRESQQRPANLTSANYEIYAAFRQGGCPLCHTEASSEAGLVASFLREGWRVPAPHGYFNRAGGLCRRHGWELYGAHKRNTPALA